MATSEEIKKAEKGDPTVVVNGIRVKTSDLKAFGFKETDVDTTESKARGGRGKVRAPEGNK